MQRYLAALLCIVMLPLVGCREQFDQLALDLDRIQHYSSRPLSDVLGASVVAGYVNYPLIDSKYEQGLNHFLHWAGKEGPTTKPEAFPFPSHHSAYYVNVYHGLVIRCWLDHGAKESDPFQLALDPSWHDAPIYPVDGQQRSINQVRELALSTGDPRLFLILSDGTRSGPLLNNAAFAADPDAFDQEVNRQLLGQFSRPDIFTFDDTGVAAPHWLQPAAQPGRTPSLESLLDRYVTETHHRKPDITRAARDGTLSFRPRDLLINHPANRQ